MWKRMVAVGVWVGVSVMAADEARIYLAPEQVVWGRGEIEVRLDLPAATQAWSYGVCIRDCDHARFLRVVRDPGMYEPEMVRPIPEFDDLILEECVITRSLLLDFGTGGSIGPVAGFKDMFTIEFEAWEPTEIAICTIPGTPGIVPVVVVDGASEAPSIGTAQVGLSPLANLTCVPEPLTCGAWKVELRWEILRALDRVRIYENGELLGEGPGDAYGGVYRGGAGAIELAVEPVLGGRAGPRLTCEVTIPTSRAGFIRGDANQDQKIDIADAITILQHLFAGSFLLYEPAADVNADAETNIADPICLLQYLFGHGAQPPAPFPDCGWAP